VISKLAHRIFVGRIGILVVVLVTIGQIEATGHPVAVFQRVDQAGYKLPIDKRVLAVTDTLIVFGLDHLPSEQEAALRRSRIDSRVAQTRRYLSAARAAS
jgi:hypothetical protein